MTWYYYMVAALFGLVFGSFYNVCIYRMPLEKTLGNRSECPSCGATIRWYDNIPLLSFLFLKGKCRHCGERISWRYPLVELTTALLFVLVYWWSVSVVPAELGLEGEYVFTPELFIGLLMVSILLIATAVDIEHGIVPNTAMYPGLILMLALVTGLALYRGQPGRIGISVASGLAGGGFLLVAGFAYGAMFMKRRAVTDEETAGDGPGEDKAPVDGLPEGGSEPGLEAGELEEEMPTGIGMGDVKLLAFVGLALGYFHWYLVLVALFLGFLFGALAAIPLMIARKVGRKDRLPFAPFLAAGSLVALVWGAQLADLYIRLFT